MWEALKVKMPVERTQLRMSRRLRRPQLRLALSRARVSATGSVGLPLCSLIRGWDA